MTVAVLPRGRYRDPLRAALTGAGVQTFCLPVAPTADLACREARAAFGPADLLVAPAEWAGNVGIGPAARGWVQAFLEHAGASVGGGIVLLCNSPPAGVALQPAVVELTAMIRALALPLAPAFRLNAIVLGGDIADADLVRTVSLILALPSLTGETLTLGGEHAAWRSPVRGAARF